MTKAKLSLAFAICLCSVHTQAQAATIITDMDNAGNADGFVQPEEIPVQNRQAIAVYAALAELDMRKPMPVSALLVGRSRYLKSLERPRLPEVSEEQTSRFSFGPVGATRVRGFAKSLPDELATSAYHETRAATIMKYVDSNRDGFMTAKELEQSRYTTYALLWFKYDRNADNRLTIEELSLYYYARDHKTDTDEIRENSVWKIDGVEVTPAHRAYGDKFLAKYDRNKDGFADQVELPQSWANGWIMETGDTDGDLRLSQTEMYRMRALYEKRREVTRETIKARTDREEELLDAADDLAEFLIPLHASGDKQQRNVLSRDRGDLQAFEDEISMADVNRNGAINETELREWITRRLESQGTFDLPPDVPLWFVESDLNNDQQVELSEFLKINRLEALSDFESCDADHDGIVTPHESSVSPPNDIVEYASADPMLVMSGQKVNSEIFVNDEFEIADIDVQIAIAKEEEDDIDLFITSPAGDRATLLIDSRRMPWSSGRVLHNSIFDDEAPSLRRPRPPLDRRWRPQSVGKSDMESLKVFYDKPIAGRWVFSIHNNTKEACLLEGWSILVRPKEPTVPSDTLQPTAIDLSQSKALESKRVE